MIIETILPFVILVLFVLSTIFFLITFFWGFSIQYERNFNNDFFSIFQENKKFGYCLIFTFLSISSLFITSEISDSFQRKKINSLLSQNDHEKYTIYINNKISRLDSIQILLRNIKKQSTKRYIKNLAIDITISKNNTKHKYKLYRDYYNSTKYWVHVIYSSTNEESNCIGEINTTQFDFIQ